MMKNEIKGYNGLEIKHIGVDYLEKGDIGVGDGAEKSRNDHKEKDWSSPSWIRLRNRVLKRDGHKCRRCNSKSNSWKKFLTVHHIIPREDGGTDDMWNLKTLCNSCHDIVEVETEESKLENEEKNILSPQQPDWHSYVYGGVKRPMYRHLLTKEELCQLNS